MDLIGDAAWTVVAVCLAAVAVFWFALRGRAPTRVMWKGFGVHVVIAPCAKCSEEIKWTGKHSRRAADAPADSE